MTTTTIVKAPTAPSAAAVPAAGAPSAKDEMAAAKGGGMKSASADTYGPVEKGETLSKIAGEVKRALG